MASTSLASVIERQADSPLIAMVDRCIALDRQLATMHENDLTDGEGPELQQTDAEVCLLSVTIRETPAVSLEGVKAKARLFTQLFAQEAHDAIAPDIDEATLGRSISADLARL